ncbi:hypothetical protein ACHBTE_27765 [Streptomyces sp. M41]|uniref:hypothetical protein n=1 Tax=Streptomyces sp. M41 TaxID=3059412 RepID=UPI00374DA9CB
MALSTSAAVAARPATGTSDPSPGYVMVEGHRVVEGTTIGEWGKTKDGELFSYTYKAGEAKPTTAPAALAAARCSVYISDVKFLGGGANAWFQWETSQACSGSFGSQKLQTQMWRSSWSGPRGYHDWRGTRSTTNQFIDYGWSSDCNDGGGTYTYYPVMKGYASGIGWGPTTRSDNELRKGCGTREP